MGIAILNAPQRYFDLLNDAIYTFDVYAIDAVVLLQSDPFDNKNSIVLATSNSGRTGSRTIAVKDQRTRFKIGQNA